MTFEISRQSLSSLCPGLLVSSTKVLGKGVNGSQFLFGLVSGWRAVRASVALVSVLEH